MEIKDNIRKLSNKKFLTFDELTDIIVECYGEVNNSNDIKEMSGENMEKILRSIFDDDSFTMTLCFNNSQQLQSILSWKYDVEKGDGYLFEK